MIVKILEALTEAELREARTLFKRHKQSDLFRESVRTGIIKPNIARINRQLGGTNDEHYLSIALQEALATK